MARLIKMNFDKPEEVRPFGDSSGKLELVNLAGGPVGRATFEPGWQWSKHVKPIAGTASCQASHMGYVISGHMKIVMDDGEEAEFGPGDFMVCPPGHDGSCGEGALEHRRRSVQELPLLGVVGRGSRRGRQVPVCAASSPLPTWYRWAVHTRRTARHLAIPTPRPSS